MSYTSRILEEIEDENYIHYSREPVDAVCPHGCSVEKVIEKDETPGFRCTDVWEELCCTECYNAATPDPDTGVRYTQINGSVYPTYLNRTKTICRGPE